MHGGPAKVGTDRPRPARSAADHPDLGRRGYLWKKMKIKRWVKGARGSGPEGPRRAQPLIGRVPGCAAYRIFRGDQPWSPNAQCRPGAPSLYFGHAVEWPAGPAGPKLLGCYHVSPQHTFTRRLTPTMLDAVLTRVEQLV